MRAPWTKRRTLLSWFSAAPLMWRVAVHGQSSRPAVVVGFLSNLSPSDSKWNLDAFRSGMEQLGYVNGRNVTIDVRYAEGRPDRLPVLAAELVAVKPQVIVTA